MAVKKIKVTKVNEIDLSKFEKGIKKEDLDIIKSKKEAEIAELWKVVKVKVDRIKKIKTKQGVLDTEYWTKVLSYLTNNVKNNNIIRNNKKVDV